MKKLFFVPKIVKNLRKSSLHIFSGLRHVKEIILCSKSELIFYARDCRPPVLRVNVIFPLYMAALGASFCMAAGGGELLHDCLGGGGRAFAWLLRGGGASVGMPA